MKSIGGLLDQVVIKQIWGSLASLQAFNLPILRSSGLMMELQARLMSRKTKTPVEDMTDQGESGGWCILA
jgi:hypothetical protein